MSTPFARLLANHRATTAPDRVDPLPADDPLPALLGHPTAAAQASAPVWRPAYEYSEPITFGGTGAPTLYTLRSYYDSPAEMTIVGFVGSDQAQAVLSSYGNPPGLSNTTVYDPTGVDGRGILVFWLAAAGSVYPDTGWFPLNSGQPLYLQLTVANSHSAWLTVQFRRRINAMGVYTVSES